MRKVLLIFVMLAVLLSFFISDTPKKTIYSSQSPDSDKKRLAFALTQPSNPNNQKLLERNNIDGLAIQISWSALEPKKDEYKFAPLTDLLALIAKHSKKASIHVFGGFGTPLWLKDLGVKFYKYKNFFGTEKEEPEPWDSTYLLRHELLVEKLAEILKEKSLMDCIFDISIATPVTEMSIIPCRNGIIPPDIKYDRTKYLEAWKRMVDSYNKHFPDIIHFISAPVGVICAPEKDAAFYTDLMSYAKQKSSNFWLFAADLKSDGSYRMSQFLSLVGNYKLAYQTLWSSTKDPDKRMRGSYPSNLKKAICKGIADGASYFELYAVDVLNDDQCIQEAIDSIDDDELCDCQ